MPEQSQPPAPGAPEPQPAPAPASPPSQLPMTLAERVELIKDILYIMAIAAAGVWALTTFWYQAVYLPARERPLITYAATTKMLGEKDGMVAIAVEVVIKNDGKVPQEFWGTLVIARGMRLETDETADGGWSEEETSPTSRRASRGYRTVVEPQPIALEADVVSMPGRRLIVSSQAEATLATMTVFVERERYDAVLVEVDLLQSVAPGQPKAEWFRIGHDAAGDLAIQATDTCTPEVGCRYFHTKFNRVQSLWH
jgi:hypothetical protein